MGNPSSTVAFSGLGTGSTQIIAADTSRKVIKIHNPNTITNVSISVCPAFDLSGNALVAGFSSAGGKAGTFVIEPGAIEEFTDNTQNAWLGAAQANSNNNVTMYVKRSAGGTS